MIIWQRIIILYIIVTQCYVIADKLQLSDAEYSKMPPLFTLDSYRSCLTNPQSIYCNIEIVLDSNETSPLLDMMKEYSKHLTRFNHQKLSKGVCVTRSCAKYINISATQQFDERSITPILQECMNESLWHDYGLDAYVTNIHYCESYEDSSSGITIGQWIVAGVLGLILAINIFGSLYANSLPTNSGGNSFLLAFSVKKNINRIFNGAKNEDHNFEPILGLRFISTFFVIMVHTGFFAAYYIENSEMLEEWNDSAWKSVILQVQTLMEFSFICSSLLLSFNCMQLQAHMQFSWSFFVKGVIDRYIRLTPVWILLIAVIAMWQPKLGSGPFWNELFEAESTSCKENWWRLLLYVGNYGDFSNNYCMLHTWYLSTDMHLFIIGLIFMMLVCRYPQQAWLLFSTLIVVGMSIPAIIIYKQGMLPIFLNRPEIRRTTLGGIKEFTHLYITVYGHLCSTAVGLLGGWFQYHIKKNEIDLRQWKIFTWTYILGIPGVILLMKIDIYFFIDLDQYEPVFILLYAGLIRLAYASLITVIILGCINKCDRYMCEFFGCAFLQCLGRMSYCAYMLHMMVLKQYFGTENAPSVLTLYNLIVIVLGCTAMTYILSLVLCVTVEYPVNELRRLLYKTQYKQAKKD